MRPALSLPDYGEPVASSAQPVPVTFESWVGTRDVPAWSTNAGARPLPFQYWRRFKEAFAPELIRRAISESHIPVRRCLDPFAGSGTTALACQFLGVEPVTIEVNPYLADLAEAKLATHNVKSLAHDFGKLVSLANQVKAKAAKVFAAAPPTFIEPGLDGRWIFDAKVAGRLACYLMALPRIRNLENRRLLRILLGGVLVDASNVVVSGKGRRYRRGWQNRRRSPGELDEAFCQAVEKAIGDIVRYAERRELSYTVLRGDARTIIHNVGPVDLVISSPPYPNSFDYTDVYNVELWGLGYLRNSAANRKLRESTLSSHVQIKRTYAPPPSGSITLDGVMKRLRRRRAKIWDANIPDMVGAYFTEMKDLMRNAGAKLPRGGEMWIVAGDSRYFGVSIPVTTILSELAKPVGYKVARNEPFRSMRASAQQGGEPELAETLLVLRRA
jgi:DNA modification methylase